jgi:large subunit ribosomal protein L24e
MVKCSFCGSELPIGGGKLFARKEGTVFYFCSNKCEKNQIVMGRKPVKTKWTEAHNKLKKTLMSANKKHETKEQAKN